MKFGFEIPAADQGIAFAPEIGSNSRVKASYEAVAVIAEISQPQEASGTLTMEIPAYEFPSGGDDLVLVCKVAARSEAPIEVVLGVTFHDNSTGTVKAVFAVPSFAKDQSANLPIGLAVDFNAVSPGDADKKVKGISGIVSVTGGAQGNRFSVMRLPSAWFDIGCKRSAEPTYPVPKPLPIACGSNASAFVLAGRSDPGAIQLSAAHFTAADGLMRLNGHVVSLMVEVLKADRVLTGRDIYGGVRLAVSPSRGDGDDEVVASAEGNFENFALFV